MRKSLNLIVIGIVIILFCDGLASACSCVPSSTVDKEFSKASAVFVGTVMKMTSAKRASAWMPLSAEGAGQWERIEQGVTIISFSVQETFKGEKNSTIEVVDSWSSCSYPFTEGQSYLVYAFERLDARKQYAGERLPQSLIKAIDDSNRDLSRLETTLCTRNEKLNNAQEEVTALRKIAERLKQRRVRRNARRRTI